MVRLTNDRWGFESNCFVCEPRNPFGLQIPFQHDVAGARVVAEFALDEHFSGAPSYVHGGVLLAILDEAMAWATIAIFEKFAVTSRTTSRFERPVGLHRDHCVTAWIVESAGRAIEVAAEVSRPDGTRCVVSDATFVVLDLDQATDAAGAELDTTATTYVEGC